MARRSASAGFGARGGFSGHRSAAWGLWGNNVDDGAIITTEQTLGSLLFRAYSSVS
jgi:hypothetical protein